MQLYTELIEKSKRYRGNIIPVSQLRDTDRPFEAYSSMFLFAPEIVQHMEMSKSETHPKGTVAGFEGNYHCHRVYFDFDANDDCIDQARLDAINLIRTLTTKFNVPSKHIFAYFSGGKGFHVSIPAKLFGAMTPSNDLPEKVRRLVVKLTEDMELNSLDESIYNVNRFFRIPNSLHEVTNLYKIPLLPKEIILHSVDEIIELATSPRIDPFDRDDCHKNDKLAAIWQIAEMAPEQSKSQRDYLEAMPQDDKEKFALAVKLCKKKKTFEQGNRNNYITYLAFLCNDLGIGDNGNSDVAYDMIHDHVANDLGDPIEAKQRSTRNSIDGAYKRKRSSFGKLRLYAKENESVEKAKVYDTELWLMGQVSTLARRSSLRIQEILRLAMALNATRRHPATEDRVYEIVMKSADGRANRPDGYIGITVSQSLERYVERYSRKNAYMATGIDMLDEQENGDYKGRLWAIIGPGGVGKSFLALQAAKGVAASGRRAVYSTMEDTVINQSKRVMNGAGPMKSISGHLTDVESNVRMMLQEQDPKKVLKSLIDDIGAGYGTNLMFDDVSRMAGDDYDWLIQQHIQRYGSLEALIVDGLSLMQSTDNETADAGRNTADLKMLANKYDILIIVLVHVPRSAAQSGIRNLEDHARASDKIKDNCDGFISLSFCMDYDKSTPGSPIMKKNLVYCRINGKRTTGVITEGILERDPHTGFYAYRRDINHLYFNDPMQHSFLKSGGNDDWDYSDIGDGQTDDELNLPVVGELE